MNVIKLLRKNLCISQSELANRLNISRQTLNKYETNTDNISIPVLKKLSVIFGIEYKYIIDNKLPPHFFNNEEEDVLNNINNSSSLPLDNEYLVVDEIVIPSSVNIRRTDNLEERFTQIFLYILTKIGARYNIVLGSLCKILYLLAYEYYKTTCTSLLYVSFVKGKYGPLPLNFGSIITSMINNKEIEVMTSTNFHDQNTKYIPLVTPSLDSVTAEDIIFINEQLDKYSSFTNEELLALICKDEKYNNTEINSLIDSVY